MEQDYIAASGVFPRRSQPTKLPTVGSTGEYRQKGKKRDGLSRVIKVFMELGGEPCFMP